MESTKEFQEETRRYFNPVSYTHLMPRQAALCRGLPAPPHIC